MHPDGLAGTTVTKLLEILTSRDSWLGRCRQAQVDPPVLKKDSDLLRIPERTFPELRIVPAGLSSTAP